MCSVLFFCNTFSSPGVLSCIALEHGLDGSRCVYGIAAAAAKDGESLEELSGGASIYAKVTALRVKAGKWKRTALKGCTKEEWESEDVVCVD